MYLLKSAHRGISTQLRLWQHVTTCLPSLRYSVLHVVFSCANKKMIWVNASPVVTGVANVKAVRYFPNKHQI